MSEPFGVEVAFWDGHIHGRRKPALPILMAEKAKRCCGGALEPNTKPHLETYDDVARYLDDIREAAPSGKWVASVYLTPEPKLKDIERLWRERLISHIKRYPPHGTTHSDESVSDEMLLDRNSTAGKALCLAEEIGLPLKHHAETLVEDDDPYHREQLSVREFLPRFRDTYTKLRQILAHLSTEQGARHMMQYGDPETYVCELTGHHLALHRGALYDGGALITNHHCLPVIKKKRHREALRKLLRLTPAYVLAGSDAAAHGTRNKYRFDAFGGLYTYHCDLELYIQVLMELGLIAYANDFLYGNAKRFHKDLVPNNPPRLRLVRESWTVSELVFLPREKPEGADDWMTPFGYHPDPKKRFRFLYKIATV